MLSQRFRNRDKAEAFAYRCGKQLVGFAPYVDQDGVFFVVYYEGSNQEEEQVG